MCSPRNDEDSGTLKHLSFIGVFVIARRLNQVKCTFRKVSRSNLETRIGASYFVTVTKEGEDGSLLLSVHCVIQFRYPGSKLSGSQ